MDSLDHWDIPVQNWSSGVWPCLFGGRLFFSNVRVLFRRISGIVINRTAWRFAPQVWGVTRMAMSHESVFTLAEERVLARVS